MSDSVTFLGTSDGLPSPDRYHASLLLRLDGRTMLVDCGEPCSHTLKRMSFDFNSLDAVYVTHSHSDHIGGLPMLLQSCWLEQRTRPLPVHLPAGVIEPFRDWIRCCHLREAELGFDIQWQPLGPGAFPTTHVHDAYCLSFGPRFAYSGDLGAVTDLAPLFPVELLVCELAHFHPQTLADFLKDKPLQRLALTHLSRQARARFAEVREIFPNAIFPRDGDSIPL
jgi:ribonuclease BN (tRNA processing enzyme)